MQNSIVKLLIFLSTPCLVLIKYGKQFMFCNGLNTETLLTSIYQREQTLSVIAQSSKHMIVLSPCNFLIAIETKYSCK